MTLSTNVYILDSIDAEEVFVFCQGMLTKYDEDRRTPERQRRSEGTSDWRGAESRRISNEIGQGLPAILDIGYRVDGPLLTAEQSAAHDLDGCNVPESEYYEADRPLCDGSRHTPAHWLDVDFDTAYGARFENGMRCGDLHAALVAELGEWLTGRGIRWMWRNEFTGEVHDDPKKLIELVRGGFEATAWYQTTALPAILGHMASGGRP